MTTPSAMDGHLVGGSNRSSSLKKTKERDAKKVPRDSFDRNRALAAFL